MKVICGIDASTSCTALSILDLSGNVLFVDKCEISKLKTDDLYAKVTHAVNFIIEKLEPYKNNLLCVGVEEPVKRFTMGASSANTIITLCIFNFAVCYELSKILKMRPEHITASTARKSFGAKFAKGTNSKDKKEVIRQMCADKWPSLTWPTNRNDNLHQWNYDIADSLVISEYFRRQHVGKNK